MRVVEIHRHIDEFSLGFVVISPGRVCALGFVPQMGELLTTSITLGTFQNVIALWPDADRLQVRLGHLLFTRRQDADNFIRADQLLGKGNLQQAGHEHGDIHKSGDLSLKKGKIAALRGDSPATHVFELFGCPLNRFQARRFIFLVNQRPDVNALDDFILDREGKSAGVTDIAGEAGVDIVENNDPQAHAVTAMVLAGFDIVDADITVLVHGILLLGMASFQLLERATQV